MVGMIYFWCLQIINVNLYDLKDVKLLRTETRINNITLIGNSFILATLYIKNLMNSANIYICLTYIMHNCIRYIDYIYRERDRVRAFHSLSYAVNQINSIIK